MPPARPLTVWQGARKGDEAPIAEALGADPGGEDGILLRGSPSDEVGLHVDSIKTRVESKVERLWFQQCFNA